MRYVARLSETPGRVDHLGRALGADNDAVYGGLLGIGPDRLADLRAASVREAYHVVAAPFYVAAAKPKGGFLSKLLGGD